MDDRLAILKTLKIRRYPDADSFPQVEMGMILPTTLTRLSIHGFPKLKYLSSVGFKNLSSLEDLSISDCPELISFPKVGLPSSLLQLYISGCPLLKNHCKRGRGKYWSMIADIPCVRIDSKFIYDQESVALICYLRRHCTDLEFNAAIIISTRLAKLSRTIALVYPPWFDTGLISLELMYE
ncbi:hypothetical protein EZV62_009296 [Acer yangbiense]|uniref:FBD domain-containing protein n=1 Tax=Acer yangbiense TaxID=1000413 RepID=A0A5C7IFX3_9ROSI|nr:hypothetical protein EZV62_009296 [Acer yangbiense]